MDIRRVKDWMGHTTIQTTMICARLAPTDLFVGADVLDQVSPAVSDGSNNVVSWGQNCGTNKGQMVQNTLSLRLRINRSNAE